MSFVHGLSPRYFNINPRGWSGGIWSPPPFDSPRLGRLTSHFPGSCSDPLISPKITCLTQDHQSHPRPFEAWLERLGGLPSFSTSYSPAAQAPGCAEAKGRCSSREPWARGWLRTSIPPDEWLRKLRSTPSRPVTVAVPQPKPDLAFIYLCQQVSLPPSPSSSSLSSFLSRPPSPTFFVFLGPHPQHMGVPGLGVESEL